MADSNTYIFLDFETGSKNKYNTQPTQLAAVAIDKRTGEILPDSEFSSYIKPIFDEEECKKKGVAVIEDKALKITKITIEQLKEAPPLKDVWNNFCGYVNRYNPSKSQWSAPIMAGFNINNFDKEIIRRIAGVKPYNFGPFDKEYQECTLFHPFKRWDIMEDVQKWMESNRDMRSISMDSLREYFSMSKDNAHNAIIDVKQGAAILGKFLKLYRHYLQYTEFKDCFKGHPEFGG